MGQKAIPVLLLFWLTFSVSASGLGTLVPIFESPLGTDPVVENIEFNGQIILKVTFQTESSFEDLKNYYREYLQSHGWFFFPLKEAFSFLSQFMEKPLDVPDSQKIHFIKSHYLLQITFFDRLKTGMFTIILSELRTPSLNLIKSRVPIQHIENIEYPGNKPIIQFTSETDRKGKVTFLVFEATSTTPVQVIDHFRAGLKNSGWKVIQPLALFQQELRRLRIFKSPEALKKMEIMQKGNKYVFIFASQSEKVTETVFGYLLKEMYF